MKWQTTNLSVKVHFVSLVHKQKQVQVLCSSIYPLRGQILGFDLVLLYWMWLFYYKNQKLFDCFLKTCVGIFFVRFGKNTPNLSWKLLFNIFDK